MLEAIDREGAFRGKILESGVSTTQKGYPQFVVRLLATQYYDETGTLTGTGEPGWVSWEEYGQQMVGYLVLFNDKGPLLNYEQLGLALEWDGSSFAELGVETAWLDKEVLFRVEDNEYQGKNRLQVNWIDHVDASPIRGIRNLDAGKLKDLDTQFAAFMNQKAKAAPVSAASKPAAPKATAPGKTAAPKAPTAPSAAAPAAAKAPVGKATAAATSTTAKAKPTLPAKKTTAPAPKAPEPEINEFEADVTATEAAAEATKDSAWAFLATSKSQEVSDDILAEAWMSACEAVASQNGFDSDDAFTAEHWAAVQNSVASTLNIAA